MKTGDSHHIESLKAEYRKQLDRQVELCAKLEAVADSLPNDFNVRECLALTETLTPILAAAHRFEEEQVFPLLKDADHSLEVNEILQRLTFEHMGDETVADELSITLRDYVTGHGKAKAETLAWMLRAFFDSMRRHLAYDADHVLPLMGQKNQNEH